MTPRLTFSLLPTAVVMCLVLAAGCAQQPVRSGVGTPTAVAATPLQSALQAVPPPPPTKSTQPRIRAETVVLPKLGSNQTCQDRSDVGYRPVLFFCQEIDSLFTATNCLDAAQLSLTLQQEDARPHPPSFNFAN